MRIFWPIWLLAATAFCFSRNASSPSDITLIRHNNSPLVEIPVLIAENGKKSNASDALDRDDVDSMASRVRKKLSSWKTRPDTLQRYSETRHVTVDASFYGVLISIGVVMIVSIGGSLAVLYLGIFRYRQISNLGQKFPLFYAVVDLLFCITSLINVIYLLANKAFPQQDACAAIGAIVHFLTGVQFMQVLGLAIYVYVAVMRHQIMSFGRWEWKWLLFCAMIAAGPVLIVLPLQGFGPMRFWCQVDMDSSSGYWNMVLLAVVYLFILMTITYCYVSVILEMRSIRKNIRRLLAGITLFKHVDETPDFIDMGVVNSSRSNRPPSGRLSKAKSFLWPRVSGARFSLFLPDSHSDTSSPRPPSHGRISPRPTSRVSPRPPQLRPQTVMFQNQSSTGSSPLAPSRPNSSPSPPLIHPQPVRSISPTSLLSTASTLALSTPRSSTSSITHSSHIPYPHHLPAIPVHATSYATSKLLLYIFMFILQYLPVIVLIITLLFKKDTQKVSSVVFGLGAGFACAGGILNLAVYTWNLNRRKV